jgi:hypothetical protein
VLRYKALLLTLSVVAFSGFASGCYGYATARPAQGYYVTGYRQPAYSNGYYARPAYYNGGYARPVYRQPPPPVYYQRPGVEVRGGNRGYQQRNGGSVNGVIRGGARGGGRPGAVEVRGR